MNARLSVTPGLRLGVVTAVLAGVALTSLWSADRASAQAPPGYTRVQAEIKIEQTASKTEPDDDCAVATFMVWPVLVNEDLSSPFYGHYIWRNQVRRPTFTADPNPEPFDDEGWATGTGGEFAFSRAPTGYHQDQIGLSTASAPGENQSPDCGKLAARYQEDYTDDQSQIWVDVPVFERAIVRGRVLGSDGKPLRGWKVKLIGRSAAASVNADAARTKLVTKTNRKGKYRFVVPGGVAAEAQDWRVAPRRARRFRPRKRTVEVAPGSKSKLRPFRKRPS